MNLIETLTDALERNIKAGMNGCIREAIQEVLGGGVRQSSAPLISTRPTRRAAPARSTRKRTPRVPQAERDARQKTILKYLTTPRTVGEVATKTNQRAATVGSSMHHMFKAGLLVKRGEKYVAKGAA